MAEFSIALIGYGAIAHRIIAILEQQNAGIGVTAIACKRGGQHLPAGMATIVDGPEALLATKPDLVVECAGHGALAEYGLPVLRSGTDLLVASVGALADPALEASLMGPAQSGWGKLILPSGAIGGLDALVAMRLAGDIQVLYRSRKPPGAWSGTPAAQLCDLDNLKKEVAFYKDTARRAVMDYPRNTNVAASVAFAGVGLDATRVELMADPEVTTNIHEIEATGPTGRFHIILEGLPDPANLKTSMLTAYSLAAEILAHSHQRGMFKKSDAIA